MQQFYEGYASPLPFPAALALISFCSMGMKKTDEKRQKDC
jgi:hypothetical protein